MKHFLFVGLSAGAVECSCFATFLLHHASARMPFVIFGGFFSIDYVYR